MTVIASVEGNNLRMDETAVGQRLHDLSDAELERHITSCGELMLVAYGRYEETSDLQDRADADGWRVAQENAIKARRPVWIASMDLQRGLR